ncbi:MAG: FkbM family methyltransferase [Candidatus Acidiferrales bacterium]
MASSLGRNWRSLWDQKITGAEFRFRLALARVPYIPVPLRLRISLNERIDFYWSYVVPFHDANRRFFDYWGHDLSELRFLWRILKSGMTFFDIGSFHGIYALVAARRLGRQGRVVAFEPSPVQRRRLKLHLRMNGFRSVRVESCAVGVDNATSEFFAIVDGDMTRGGLRPPASPDTVRSLPVEVVSLDQYVLENSMHGVDVIKLDVEGAELDVFRGATRVLTKMRPTILCEILDLATRAWGYEAREIIDMLERYDFAWFEFGPDGTLMPHQIQARYSEVRNYLAVPRERCESGVPFLE